jgi:hypothetical protein
MASDTKKTIEQLRGASQLVTDATVRATEVVESMHTTIASGPAVLGKPLAVPVAAVNRLVYGSIRGISQLVGNTIELALRACEPLFAASAVGAEREAMLSALNGVVGDHLAATENPMAIKMSFRSNGRSLTLERESLRQAFPNAGSKILLAIHGSSMNDLQWTRNGHNHALTLSETAGMTPLYLHYNSGKHTSLNGRELSEMLSVLVEQWPVPVEQLVFLAHSMGGLVSRSACTFGDNTPWRRVLQKMIFLGTPHHGAPLERGGNWFELMLGLNRYAAPLARLAKLRSAGVTDLRFGNVVDAHWEPGRPVRFSS